MTNKMSRQLQECHNNNSNPTSQSAVSPLEFECIVSGPQGGSEMPQVSIL